MARVRGRSEGQRPRSSSSVLERHHTPFEEKPDNSSIESTRSAGGELGWIGWEREWDWEVLDTCLNADDMSLVGSAYLFLKDRGFLPNFGNCRNIVIEGLRDSTPSILKSSTGLEVYLMGCPIRGVILGPVVAIQMGIQGQDFLEDLWGRIQDLSNNGWKLESVLRPHLSFEAQLVAGKSHDLGPINCPEQPGPPAVLSAITYGKQKHVAELKYPQRIHRLNIFPASKTEIWPHIVKLEAEVLIENVHPLFRKAVYFGLRRPLNE